MVTIRKKPTNEWKSPGTWWRWMGQVLVACPRCGLTARLNHAIAADGTLSPSLHCPSNDCTFHESARLEDWDAEPA